jgi:hypothetical protein
MTRRRVVLYTKPGCHLCEVVARVIEGVRSRRDFDFVRANILENPDDFEKFKHDIPVITVDGVEIARHRLTAEALEDALGGAA